MLALLAGLAVFPWGSGRADVASANLQVAARVVPYARLAASSAPATIAVTSSDVERGFVDVSRSYTIRTNAPERILIQMHPRVGLAHTIDVAGFSAPLTMGGDSLEVAELLSPQFTLTFRLWLAPQAAAGEYPLPVHLTAGLR